MSPASVSANLELRTTSAVAAAGEGGHSGRALVWRKGMTDYYYYHHHRHHLNDRDKGKYNSRVLTCVHCFAAKSAGCNTG